MPRWPRRLSTLLAAAVFAGCAALASGPASVRAPDYRGVEVRRPAVMVRVAFGPGDFADHERASLPELYTGALLEMLNVQGVPAVDVTVAADRPDRAATLARAAEVHADHAVVVEATVARQLRTYCREARRPFTTRVTEWAVGLTVLRVSDGQTRLREPDIPAEDVEPDCDDPPRSERLPGDETIARSVRRVVAIMLRP